LLLAKLGLGVLVAILLEAGICGRRSGTIPKPAGAGVGSRDEGWIGLGVGFLEGSRDGWLGEVIRGRPLLNILSFEMLMPTRLLCITVIDSPTWDCKAGAPSLLGRNGGVPLIGDCTKFPLDLAGDGFDGEVITGSAEAWEAFDGEFSSSDLDFLNFWDDFRGGGLGGRGDSLFFFFFSLSFGFPSPITVELEEDDVNDSRNDGRPWGSTSLPSLSLVLLPALLLVMGGRVMAGLPCRNLGVVVFIGATMLGDWEDIDVGVVSLL
jgi:hypothetical protein